jgi:hypothetical protein
MPGRATCQRSTSVRVIPPRLCRAGCGAIRRQRSHRRRAEGGWRSTECSRVVAPGSAWERRRVRVNSTSSIYDTAGAPASAPRRVRPRGGFPHDGRRFDPEAGLPHRPVRQKLDAGSLAVPVRQDDHPSPRSKSAGRSFCTGGTPYLYASRDSGARWHPLALTPYRRDSRRRAPAAASACALSPARGCPLG